MLRFEEAAEGFFGLEGGERLMALGGDLRQTPEAERVAVAGFDEQLKTLSPRQLLIAVEDDSDLPEVVVEQLIQLRKTATELPARRDRGSQLRRVSALPKIDMIGNFSKNRRHFHGRRVPGKVLDLLG
ncbi:hypothetical protein [Actinoallomurus sp. NPDC050550]|uniref:hypothetical protein n=1 Tax=Actinoallomurus sp. NPDC050550 TaxID=3154937 RepID=UPI0033D8D47D